MEMKQIGHEILNQDNLATDQPMFVVEARELVVTDQDYATSDTGFDGAFWCSKETGKKFQRGKSEYYAALDVLEKGDLLGDKWVHLHFAETWRFVTVCFTSAAAHQFIERKGHDYPDGMRVYAYGSMHNHEYQAVRQHLIGLAGGENE